MNAAYLEPDVRLDPATRTAHARFSVRNESPETWRASEGFGFGYHLFDADTGTLIVDGARVHPELVDDRDPLRRHALLFSPRSRSDATQIALRP